MPSTSRKPAARRPRRRARKPHPADTAKVVNVHDAKTQLSRLLVRVERGERITIARAGKVVAVMAPPTAASEPPPLPPDDPLLNLDKFSINGPGGMLTNEEIDRILYGGS